jgi:hypothetical protein
VARNQHIDRSGEKHRESRRWAGARMRLPSVMAAWVAVAVGAVVAPAIAGAGAAATLHWKAPASCPDQAAVQRQLDTLLQNEETLEPVRADVVVQQDRSGFRARVSITSGHRTGVRNIEAASCDEVVRAASVIVAIAVNPALAARIAASSIPSASSAPVASVSATSSASATLDAAASGAPGLASAPPATSAPVSPVVPPQTSSPSAIEAWIVGGLESGSVPSTTAWFGLGALYWRSHFGAAGLLSTSLPRKGTTSEQPEAGGTIGLVSLLAAPCVRLDLGSRTGAGVCVGPEANLSHGSGTGVSQPRSATIVWPSVSSLADIGYRWGRVRAGLLAGVAVPLARPAFFLDDIGTIHRPGVSGRLALEAALTF